MNQQGTDNNVILLVTIYFLRRHSLRNHCQVTKQLMLVNHFVRNAIAIYHIIDHHPNLHTFVRVLSASRNV